MRILVSNTWPLPDLRDRARIRATGDSLIIVVASFIRSLRNRIMSVDNRWSWRGVRKTRIRARRSMARN